MKHLKKTILTLVALLAVTAGAWADDQSESFTTATNEQLTYTGEHFTISGQKADTDGFWIGNAGGSDNTVTISSRNGENITKIEAVLSYEQNWGDTKLATTSGKVTGTYVIGQTITISSVNATTVTLSGPEGEFKLIEFNSWTIYYGDAPTAVTVDWNKTSKTGTFGMPGGNVELEPEYYPQATAAEGAVTAATDVAATTDAPLVTVDATQLTGVAKMMYYVSTSTTAPAYDAEGWTDVLPTAEKYTEAANLNVWYYPVGTDEGVGGATATYSDGDMNATALAVSLGDAPLWNAEFDLTDAPEEDKAEGVWTTDIPEGGVTKGTEVKVTYTGSRKVIGVKAEKKAAPKLLNFSPLGQIFYYYEGETWGDAIRNHPENQANGWYIEEFGITVMYKGRALCDSAHDDDITKDTVVNPNGGYLWGPES